MTTLRLEYVDPATLSDNPANWRRHPEQQQRAVSAAIAECGWVKPCIYNERTGRLIDGHLRRKIALGDGPIPVVIGSWDEPTERKILATLDNTGLLAETDAAAWDALLKGNGLDLAAVNTASEDLADLLTAVSESAGLLSASAGGGGGTGIGTGGDDDPGAPPPEPPGREAVPDALWPSDNEWGIPSLDPALQADAVDFPVTTWGSIGHGKAMRGTYHFYTDDGRFDPLWSNPAKVLLSGCPSVVEPNFSTHSQTPRAVALWAIYRKRWLGRYWQSKGLRLFVDLNVHQDLAPLNLLGVPRGWRAYATRSHGNAPELLEREHRTAVDHAGTESLLFLVVGGGVAVKQLAGERGWVWVPEHSDVVRGRHSNGQSAPQ